MSIPTRFGDVRHLWMTRYISELVEYRARFQPGGPEVLLQLSDNGSPAPFRLYRVDLASGAVDPPNLTDINLDSLPDFSTEHYVLPRGVRLSIEPFHWNGAEFSVRDPLKDVTLIAKWCERWLDIPEGNPPDENGLLGAIHSVTAPELRQGATFFSVDFGTAPVLAARVDAAGSCRFRCHGCTHRVVMGAT